MSEYFSPVRLNHMMGCVSDPALVTTGFSASGGRSPSACWTAFDTSVAARSMSRPALSSTLIEPMLKAEVEVMVRMPSIPLSTCSIGSTMVASMVSGLAPK
jgi:hypothetical protein